MVQGLEIFALKYKCIHAHRVETTVAVVEPASHVCIRQVCLSYMWYNVQMACMRGAASSQPAGSLRHNLERGDSPLAHACT